MKLINDYFNLISGNICPGSIAPDTLKVKAKRKPGKENQRINAGDCREFVMYQWELAGDHQEFAMYHRELAMYRRELDGDRRELVMYHQELVRDHRVSAGNRQPNQRGPPVSKGPRKTIGINGKN